MVNLQLIDPSPFEQFSGTAGRNRGSQNADEECTDLKILVESMKKMTEMLDGFQREQTKFWDIFNQCTSQSEHLQFELNKWTRKLDNLLQDIGSSRATNLEMVHLLANLQFVFIVSCPSGFASFVNVSTEQIFGD